MTNIYFVRHCEPDFSIYEDLIRPLTDKGLKDEDFIGFREIGLD